MVDHAEEGGGGAQIDVFTTSAAIKKCLEMEATYDGWLALSSSKY